MRSTTSLLALMLLGALWACGGPKPPLPPADFAMAASDAAMPPDPDMSQSPADLASTWNPDPPTGFEELPNLREKGLRVYWAPSTYPDYLAYINLREVRLASVLFEDKPQAKGQSPVPFNEFSSLLFPRGSVNDAERKVANGIFFFNTAFNNGDQKVDPTEISFSLKSGSVRTGGTRPMINDGQQKFMLVIHNDLSVAKVVPSDVAILRGDAGDQIVEGLGPLEVPPGTPQYAARVMVGVRPGGTEVVIYCSASASHDDAKLVLDAASVPADARVQLDGGSSATCGKRGIYFPYSPRRLPAFMVAVPR